jgi:chromate transport protein ChrA
LTRLRSESWIGGFVKGLAPALAALLLITAYNLVGEGGWGGWPPLLLGLASLVAMAAFRVPPAIVLIAAGLIGIILFR